MTTAPPTNAALLGDILAAVQALRLEIADLRAVVDSHGVRDAADGAALRGIREAIGPVTWTAAELIHHARIDPALRAALLTADLVSAHDIGVWCRRGPSWEGLSIAQAGDSRAGKRWTVRMRR